MQEQHLVRRVEKRRREFCTKPARKQRSEERPHDQTLQYSQIDVCSVRVRAQTSRRRSERR